MDRTAAEDDHNRLLHGGVIRKREQSVHPTAAAAAAAAADDHKNVTGTNRAAGDQPQTPGRADGGEQTRVVTASACPGQKTGAMLQVVPVTVYGENGSQQTYALLDPGSETSFCTETLLSKLQMTGDSKAKLRLRTVDGDGKEKLTARVQLQVSATGPSAADHRRRIMVPEAWSVAALKVSRPPVSQEQLDSWTHLRGLEIPNCSDMTVELLLGANVTEAVIQHEVRVGQPRQPIAVRTAFGWALTGLVSEAPKASRQVMFVTKDSMSPEVEERTQKTLKRTTDKMKLNRYPTILSCLIWMLMISVCGLASTNLEVKTEINSYLAAVSTTGSWLSDTARYSSGTNYKRTTRTRMHQTDTLQTAKLLRTAEEIIPGNGQARGERIRTITTIRLPGHGTPSCDCRTSDTVNLKRTDPLLVTLFTPLEIYDHQWSSPRLLGPRTPDRRRRRLAPSRCPVSPAH